MKNHTFRITQVHKNGQKGVFVQAIKRVVKMTCEVSSPAKTRGGLGRSDRSETKTPWHFPQNVIVFDATQSLRWEKELNEERTKTRWTFKFSPPLNVRQ